MNEAGESSRKIDAKHENETRLSHFCDCLSFLFFISLKALLSNDVGGLGASGSGKHQKAFKREAEICVTSFVHPATCSYMSEGVGFMQWKCLGEKTLKIISLLCFSLVCLSLTGGEVK
jgi:hypothetical protein